MVRNITSRIFFYSDVTEWQKQRGELFREASGIDKDAELKKAAGVKKLNEYSNLYEIQTLCDFLNTDYETVLNSDDTFCTKVLLSNVEKCKFESEFQRLKSKQRK